MEGPVPFLQLNREDQLKFLQLEVVDQVRQREILWNSEHPFYKKKGGTRYNNEFVAILKVLRKNLSYPSLKSKSIFDVRV